jgi:hypothetical protein
MGVLSQLLYRKLGRRGPSARAGRAPRVPFVHWCCVWRGKPELGVAAPARRTAGAGGEGGVSTVREVLQDAGIDPAPGAGGKWPE